MGEVEEATYFADLIGATAFTPSLSHLKARQSVAENNTSLQHYQKGLLSSNSLFSHDEKPQKNKIEESNTKQYEMDCHSPV